MALHDPDSSAAEKAIALKIGRQKKIQIIDGQQVKLTQLNNIEVYVEMIKCLIPSLLVSDYSILTIIITTYTNRWR